MQRQGCNGNDSNVPQCGYQGWQTKTNLKTGNNARLPLGQKDVWKPTNTNPTYHNRYTNVECGPQNLLSVLPPLSLGSICASPLQTTCHREFVECGPLDCGGASTFLSPLSMTNPITAIYRESNSEIHLSPSHEHYPSVVRDFILPHVDFFTTLVVVAGDNDYLIDDVTEIEFRLVQEHPSLFAITNCNDDHFLKYYMVKNNLVSEDTPLDVLDHFLWKDYVLYGIMLQERSSLVNISRDGFETRIVSTDWDDEDIDPEVHTLIGHLGQGDGHVQNSLALLPVK
ncbi:hypothetical protein JTE90_015017 [Oedothorax gibbosus]|uniref:Uncharacterized protein n=1 Tax=Oedothorax gibbosus TaxID=931172 RepID=A0AAV6TVX4_9ARAC|nr:hypothetical protein JTE90_015017 [Oedothorax gibbosus]